MHLKWLLMLGLLLSSSIGHTSTGVGLKTIHFQAPYSNTFIQGVIFYPSSEKTGVTPINSIMVDGTISAAPKLGK